MGLRVWGFGKESQDRGLEFRFRGLGWFGAGA